MSLEASIESLVAALEKNTASVQSHEKVLQQQIDLQRQIVEGQGRILEQAQQASAGKGAKASAKTTSTKSAAAPAAEKKADPAPAATPAAEPETAKNPYAGDAGFAKLKGEVSLYLNVDDATELADRKTKFAKLIEHCGGRLTGNPKGLPTIPEDRRMEFGDLVSTLARGEDLPEIFGESKSEEDDLLG